MDLEFRGPDGTLHQFTLDPGRGSFTATCGEDHLTGSWLRVGPNTLSLLTGDGRSHLVHLAHDENGVCHLQYEGRTYQLADPADDDAGTAGGGGAAGGDINERGEVLSPMPGKVVGLPVSVGDTVAPGDLLVILESMKMENPVLSPVAGTVSKIPLAVGDSAALGDPLMQLEVATGDE